LVHFNRLRISGFKSFVDPTEVPIEPGVTGIVGPNGCGKSNLVEALRWVMGETSAKRMRGGEMDDVIFAGSVARPSRNIAEVSLLLDNSDRSAVAHFNDREELEVTRRIERGSGSSYRVNGQEARARDVQLLFADAASGAHSTALVGQGRIGAIINAKPVDRRALLEEAAGITGLHSRRHEAELRLRAAETNLERLDDVISTLEGQFQSLKRQARQASRYRNLAGHIRRHEAMLLHLDVEAAKTALAATRERLTAVQAQVAALTQSAAAAATGQGEAAAQLPALRQSEAAAAAALQRLLVDRDNLDREEAQVAAAQQQAEQRRGQIESDRARAQSLADDATTAQTRLEAELATLAAEAEGEGEARAEAERLRNAAAASASERETAVNSLAEQVAATEAQTSSLDRRVAELGERLARLNGEAERVAAQRADLAAQVAADSGLSEAAAALGAAEGSLGRARAAADDAEAALAAGRAAESEARERLQAADSERGKLEAEIAALAALLEPAEADIWPPLIDSLHVDPGYEAALGAALGEDLAASGDEAAPVHWLTLPELSDAAALPGVAGGEVQPLSAYVRGPQALNRRLAQIGVVADSASGERLQRGLRSGQRLVSRDGGLWRWDGFTIKAGAPTAATQRLEQRNRLALLRPKLDEAGTRVEGLRADFESKRRAAEQAAEAERAARNALREAFTQTSQARDAHGQLAQESAARQSRLSALDESGERLRGEIAEAGEACERAREERAALPDLAAARDRLSLLRAELAEQRHLLSERQSALDGLLREAEMRAGRRAAVTEEHASWQQRAEAARGHIAELDARQAEVRREIDDLAHRPAELAERREALAALIETAEDRRRAAADALASGETRLAEADRALKAEEHRLAETREDRVRAEAGVAQAEQTLDQLTARVMERLDCPVDNLLELAEVDPGQELPVRDDIEGKLARLVRERDNMGPVNLRAEQEAEELEQQITGMQTERTDLVSAIARLRQGIASLNREGRERLLAAFELVNGHFTELFVRLFGGGRAHLALTEAEDPLDAGLEIMASPPGKRLQVMSLLSGGEQALTALALLFAVFLTNPAPICVLDEVDAPLDDSNVDRFCSLVDELAERTQTRFLVITHHRMTMARVDRLFGVTMAERGVSQLVSVDLETAETLRESA
jgi:chromosome segregation protein